MLDFIHPKTNMAKYGKSLTGNNNNSKSWTDIIIDSAIVAGITFFSTWSGNIDIAQLLITAKATGLTFFLQVAYEKGIKRYNQR